MTHIATCGHDITNSPAYQVAEEIMVNNLDGDPPLVPAESVGVYCEACMRRIVADGKVLWLRIIE